MFRLGNDNGKPPSILDDLGEEITGIVTPVSICMAITVLLVKLLNPEGTTDSNTVYIANIAYSESETDSSGQKLGGALLNALIFVGIVAAMTFVLVALFYFQCYKVIYGYLAFAIFNIFFFITGAIIISVLKKMAVSVDAFTLTFLLFNFSVVGTAGLIFVQIQIPLLMKQVYLVWVGIMTAFIFTFIPEWTSWVILVAMALYDILAVLIPGGPLKLLVKLAVERQQELPALVYETRPVGRGYQRGYWRPQAAGQPVAEAGHSAVPMVSESPPGRRQEVQLHSRGQALGESNEHDDSWSQLQAEPSSRSHQDNRSSNVYSSSSPGLHTDSSQPLLNVHGVSMRYNAVYEADPGDPMHTGESPSALTYTQARQRVPHAIASQDMNHYAPPQPQPAPQVTNRGSGHDAENPRPLGGQQQQQEEEDDLDLPDSIKLGLGDFIFYSMLVGRAAMYDMMTVFSSYVAIIAGLVLTLLCLMLFKRALPALPFSIALGVVFYFLTRIILEPYIVPLATHYTLF